MFDKSSIINYDRTIWRNSLMNCITRWDHAAADSSTTLFVVNGPLEYYSKNLFIKPRKFVAFEQIIVVSPKSNFREGKKENKQLESFKLSNRQPFSFSVVCLIYMDVDVCIAVIVIILSCVYSMLLLRRQTGDKHTLYSNVVRHFICLFHPFYSWSRINTITLFS